MNKHTQVIRNTLIATSLLMGSNIAIADPLQPDTLYANTGEGLYAIDETTWTATRVGTTDPLFSDIQDITYSSGKMYGISTLMQFFEYDETQENMIGQNGYQSYADQFYGLDSYQGEFYVAGRYGLYRVETSNMTYEPVGGYGLGAGEEVTDLAFADNGTLYALVDFNITYGSQYLATLDVNTGEMNLLGATYINGARGLTFKNGTLYAINSSGDLYSVDPASGFGTLIQADVVPGALGLGRTPAALNAGGGDGSSGGALSLPMLLLIGLLPLLRKRFARA